MPWTPPDPDSPLRIAYLTYRGKPHVGGQGVYSRHLTKALVDLGHHVEVYGGPPYPIIDERIPFHPLPSLDIWADPHPMRKPRAVRPHDRPKSSSKVASRRAASSNLNQNSVADPGVGRYPPAGLEKKKSNS